MKKKYITPVVRSIYFDMEDVLLVGSIGKSDSSLENENQILSNERTASSSIWDKD